MVRVLRRCRRLPLSADHPLTRGSPPVRRGRGVGPADRAPHPAPPYRGVRGVRGSTVGGAPTAHARHAWFRARFPLGPISKDATGRGLLASAYRLAATAPPVSARPAPPAPAR